MHLWGRGLQGHVSLQLLAISGTPLFATLESSFERRLWLGDEMTASTTVDISETAISIFTRTPLKAGTTIEVHLATNGNENWIQVTGKVLRVEAGVMAVEFVSFPKKEMEELGTYLRDLQQQGRSELIAV